MSAADRLREQRTQPAIRDYALLQVVALSGDSSVVATDGDVEATYRCTSGYPKRTPGDLVLALQLASGAWLIMCAVGAPPYLSSTV